MLHSFVKLKRLDLSSNRLTVRDIEYLFENILESGLTWLSEINLSSNISSYFEDSV